MKMPLSEIIDRYSILLLKHERLVSEDLSREIDLYKKEINFDTMKIYIDELYEINGKIWDLESDIRKGKENLLGLEEVGRRAIAIRELNKQRVSVKNKIVKLTGEGFVDVKMNHASS